MPLAAKVIDVNIIATCSHVANRSTCCLCRWLNGEYKITLAFNGIFSKIVAVQVSDDWLNLTPYCTYFSDNQLNSIYSTYRSLRASVVAVVGVCSFCDSFCQFIDE